MTYRLRIDNLFLQVKRKRFPRSYSGIRCSDQGLPDGFFIFFWVFVNPGAFEVIGVAIEFKPRLAQFKIGRDQIVSKNGLVYHYRNLTPVYHVVNRKSSINFSKIS